MKIKPLVFLAALSGWWVLAAYPALAQINLVSSLPPPSSPAVAIASVSTQLQDLQAKVQARATVTRKEGPDGSSQKAWADIIQAYDALLTAHKNEKNDNVAQIALAKAMLYAGIADGGVFHQWDICAAQLQEVAKGYPGTPTAQQATALAQKFRGDAEFMAARRQLVGQVLPDFHVLAADGKSLSPAGLKGKVVLLDFWGGPGCAPCLLEMPTIAKVYAQYRAQGFEVVGVCWPMGFSQGGGSIKSNLAAFLKQYNMTWPEFCDGAPLNSGKTNELFDKLRVTGGGVPANYLVGRDGKIIGMDLHGDDLDDAVAKAMAAK